MNLKTRLRGIKNRILNNPSAWNLLIKLVNTPIIGHIYDYFYFDYVKKTITKAPYYITIEPNNICNLKCIMCPYQRMKRKKETMPLGLFKKIVDNAEELGSDHIHLTQYNEPFTDNLLFDRLAYINKKGIESSFYSNAMLMNKEKRKKLLESPPTLIRFSVDGAKKQTLEAIRKGAVYETVISNIVELFNERNEKKQKLPIIEVFMTLQEKNKTEAKTFLKFWKGKCDFATIFPVDSRESDKFLNINYKKLKPYPCFNPKRVLIMSNGKVAMCCVDIDGKIELGDIRKQTLKEILNSKKYQELYQSHMNRKCPLDMCRNCSKLYIDSAFSWWFY